MAPARITKPDLILAVGSKRVKTNNVISTRTSKITKSSTNNIYMQQTAKRKAECSPLKENGIKRSAFGDITNAIDKTNKGKENNSKKATIKLPKGTKKVKVQAKILPTVKTVAQPKRTENVNPPPAPVNNKPRTRSTQIQVETETALKSKLPSKEIGSENQKIKTRLSCEFEKAEESLYSTALEDINISNCSSSRSSNVNKEKSNGFSKISLVAQQLEKQLNLDDPEIPEGIEDFDRENWKDPFQVSNYAMDIFNYYKERESKFVIKDYMKYQQGLTQWMRSLLVDWMVEIQENFELNHETLYLGVKLVDLYLSKVAVDRDTLQLVGVAAIFMASKYDERIPPSIGDFLYICDGAYTRRQLLRMEISIFKTIDFDLGIPLSYRFLRRYGRCAKINMPTLTLARYILEYSLMDYATVMMRDSKLAAASLYIALKMRKISGWTSTLEYYTGYKLSDIIDVTRILNNALHKKPKEQAMTIVNKYSHEIFFEVALTPLIPTKDL